MKRYSTWKSIAKMTHLFHHRNSCTIDEISDIFSFFRGNLLIFYSYFMQMWNILVLSSNFISQVISDPTSLVISSFFQTVMIIFVRLMLLLPHACFHCTECVLSPLRFITYVWKHDYTSNNSVRKTDTCSTDYYSANNIL